MSKKGIIIPLLMATGMLLTASVIYADMAMTNWVDAWDVKIDQYSHSLQDMPVDCVTWIPFWHEFAFDNDVYPTRKDLDAYWLSDTNTLVPYPTDACPDDANQPDGTGEKTPWASLFEYAIYHDNPEAYYGIGFKWSRNWEAVRCDRDGDGDFDADDMTYIPPYSRTTIIDDPGDMDSGFAVLAQNVITSWKCGGNCDTELITTLFVNFDTDCDGTIDEPFASEWISSGMCFFAEALVPCPPGDLLWGTGNIQARITRVGGEKTINFHQDETITPVMLASFTASWIASNTPPAIMWGAVALVLIAAIGALTWRVRRALR
jgi:hypothetical protein